MGTIIPGSRGRAGLAVRLLQSELGVDANDLQTQQELAAQLVILVNHLQNGFDARESQLSERETNIARTLKDYKERVRQGAMAAAIKYGWCAQVQDILADLDITLEEPTLTATVTVTYEITAKVPYDHVPSVDGGGKAFIAQHLNVPAIRLDEGSGTLITISAAGDLFDPANIELSNVQLEGDPLIEAVEPERFHKP